MRRYTFYLSIALMAFGIGSFVVFKFYWNTQNNFAKSQENVLTSVFPRNFGDLRSDIKRDASAIQTEYQSPDKKKIGFTCMDKNFLPFWNELQKDERFQERAKDFQENSIDTSGDYQDADCSKMLEIQKIDLNNDGQKESVLWGKNGNLCGGTGNCDIWIYEKKNGRYKLLLQSNAYNDETKWLELKKAKSNNYQDILLKTHFSAAETVYEFYKFNGNKYIENKCLFYDYYSAGEEPTIMTCKERFKN